MRRFWSKGAKFRLSKLLFQILNFIRVLDMVKGDVFVNDRRINTQKQTLYHGDVLRFGKCRFLVDNSNSGDEQFKLVNTRDENLSDSINERQSLGNLGGYTLEPKLNLVDQRDNFAKINYLSDHDYD